MQLGVTECYDSGMTPVNPNARRGKSGFTAKEIRERATETHKNCIECGEFKPLDEFPINKKGFLGRYSQCRTCWNTYVNNRNKRPDVKAKRKQFDSTEARLTSMRNAFVKRKYGEDGLEIEKRRVNGDVCDVCGKMTEKMVIDHCHDTQKTRGLLCTNCNLALGYVKDDVDILKKLITYLEGGD